MSMCRRHNFECDKTVGCFIFEKIVLPKFIVSCFEINPEFNYLLLENNIILHENIMHATANNITKTKFCILIGKEFVVKFRINAVNLAYRTNRQITFYRNLCDYFLNVYKKHIRF